MKLTRVKCYNCKHNRALNKWCNKHNTENTYYLKCGEFEDMRDPEEILKETIDKSIVIS